MNRRVTDTFMNRHLEFELKVNKEQQKSKGQTGEMAFRETVRD